MNRPDLEPGLMEAESADAREIAREQFVHGLLETVHRDGVEDRERRIVALRMAMRRESSWGGSWLRARWRVVSGLAAAAVLVIAAVLAMPTRTSASAMVQASMEALKSAGDRRYQITARLPREEEGGKEIGTLDVRGSDSIVVRALTPHGDQIVVGRNGEETWAIRHDGTVDRYPPRHAWPRWVDFGQTTVLLAPMEELLESLGKTYELEKLGREAPPTGKGPECERVRGIRPRGPSPDPARVDLWIDPESKLVRRMELHWPPRRPPPREGGPGPREGGPPREARDGEGPRRPPPPPRDGRGPEGRGRPPHPPPEFLREAPDFEGGRRPPPPRLLVFELVDGVTFEAGWFEPGAHTRSGR